MSDYNDEDWNDITNADIRLGKRLERERIITMLEAKADALHASHILNDNNSHRLEQSIWKLIAAIKGASK